MPLLSWILCGFMDFGCAFDGLWHGIVTFFASLIWKVEQLILQLGGVLHWLRRLIVGDEGISQSLLGEIMDQLLVNNDLLKNLLGGALLLAGVLLCFTFMLRPVFRVVAVEPGKVVGWLLFALVMFEAGPGFAQGLERFRDNLREGAYQSVERADYSGVLGQANGDFVTSSDLCGQANCVDSFVHVLPDSTGPCEGGRGCNGIDAAALYLMANTDDIVGRSPQGSDTKGLPASLYNRFFVWPADDGQANRENANNLAAQGFVRVTLGFLICIFALVEALIFLLLAAAALILFITIPIALPFAFFSMTEVILLTLVRKYLSILVLTFVAQTMITILMMLMIFFAGKGNGVLFIAVGLLSAAIIIWGFLGHATGSLKGAIGAVGTSVGLAVGVPAANSANAAAARRMGSMGTMLATGGAAALGGAIGAAAVVSRNGGLGQGGGRALAQAGLHAARTRISSVAARTPLSGIASGYVGTQSAYSQAVRAREMRVERNALDAMDVLTGKRQAPPGMLRRAERQADEYMTMREVKELHASRARNIGLGRLVRGGDSGIGAARSFRRVTSGTPPTGTNGRVISRDAHGQVTDMGGTSTGEGSLTGLGADPRAQVQGAERGAHDGEATVDQSQSDKDESSVPGAQAGNTSQSRGERSLDGGRARGSASAGAGSGGGRGRAHSKPLRRLRGAPSDEARARRALVAGKAIGRDQEGNLMTYAGVKSNKELESLPGYRLVTMETDVNSLLEQGLYVQRSRRAPGMLMVWDGAQGPAGDSTVMRRWSKASHMQGSESWGIGVDADAGALVQERVHSLLDSLDGVSGPSSGAISLSALAGAFPQLSDGERGRLQARLGEGAYTPSDVGAVVDATRQTAEAYGGAGGGGGGGGGGDPRAIAQAFLGPDGRIDMRAPGTRAVLGLAGGAAQRLGGEDAQTILAASLGLMRPLSWGQLKGAIVGAAQGRRDIEQTLLHSSGAQSLGSSKGAMLGFVAGARRYNLGAGDVATALDLAGLAGGGGVDLPTIVEATEVRGRQARLDKLLAAGLNGRQARSIERVWGAVRSKRLGPGSAPGVRPPLATARAHFSKLLTDAAVIGHEVQATPLASYLVSPFVSPGPAAALAADGPPDHHSQRGGEGAFYPLDMRESDTPPPHRRSSTPSRSGVPAPGGGLLPRIGLDGSVSIAAVQEARSVAGLAGVGVGAAEAVVPPDHDFVPSPALEAANPLPMPDSVSEEKLPDTALMSPAFDESTWYLQELGEQGKEVTPLPEISGVGGTAGTGMPQPGSSKGSHSSVSRSAGVQSLLSQGQDAALRGDRVAAWSFLTQVVEADPHNEHAWLWLSEIVEAPEDRQTCLENVMVVNPGNVSAARALRYVSAQTGVAPRIPFEPPEPS